MATSRPRSSNLPQRYLAGDPEDVVRRILAADQAHALDRESHGLPGPPEPVEQPEHRRPAPRLTDAQVRAEAAPGGPGRFSLPADRPECPLKGDQGLLRLGLEPDGVAVAVMAEVVEGRQPQLERPQRRAGRPEPIGRPLELP